MNMAGKLIGVLLGIPFGVFGVIFGLVAGTLVDQVLAIRRNQRDLEKFYLEGVFVPRLKRFLRPAAAIGLAMGLLSVDDQPPAELKEVVISRIQKFFHIRSIEEKRLEQFWDVCESQERNLDIPWLVRVYGVSDPEFLELSRMYSYAGEGERDFLFSLLHHLAGADSLGVSRNEYQFLKNVFEPMGLAVREIRERLRSVPYLNRTYRELLELPEGCSEQDLKKRYRDLAAQLHPDSSVNIGYGEEDSSEQEKRQAEFSRLQQAYDELLWQFRYSD